MNRYRCAGRSLEVEKKILLSMRKKCVNCIVTFARQRVFLLDLIDQCQGLPISESEIVLFDSHIKVFLYRPRHVYSNSYQRF